MEKCSRCGKNIAVVFITKIEGSTTRNEGLCLVCAKELNIPQIDQFASRFGVTPDEIDMLNVQMNDMLSEDFDYEDDDTEEVGSTMQINKLLELFNKTPGTGETQAKAGKTSATTAKKKHLDNFGVNLTKRASEGKIDRIVGRDEEITRAMQILNRRSKNNPVLIGEPGVGKTAIVEGLAMRIVEGNVPAKLRHNEVYLLDFTSIVSGTQFRGQFEMRLKNILDETRRLGNVILFIDELHSIVAAGDAEGAMDAANILKPALARGEIQVIGATTLKEYRKYIEKDAALERRFQPIIVEQPSVEDAITVLEGVKHYYEDFHHVEIPKSVARAATILSERYINDRFLPDKAIDIIDEACAKVNLESHDLSRLEALKSQLEVVQEQKENAVSEDSIEAFQKAADCKMQECQLKKEIAEIESVFSKPCLTIDDVAKVIEQWTKIPIASITQHESARLLCLADRLKTLCFEQDLACELIANSIKLNRAGLLKERRPSSFIFVGPTGVGKTHLAKMLAKTLFDSEQSLIVLDMSEYMEKHSVAKMTGSPPGYVGYDEAGQLTEKVRRKPYSVILFDEIEKAHPDVFNMLLQILDDGRITDSQGRSVSFANTIIILTSNCGTEWRSVSMGFGDSNSVALKNKVDKALKETFRPEFLNRIDEVVVFNPLTAVGLKSILRSYVADFNEMLAERNMSFELTPECEEYCITNGFDEKNGARPLKRLLQKELISIVAHNILEGTFSEGDKLIAHVEEGKLSVARVPN